MRVPSTPPETRKEPNVGRRTTELLPRVGDVVAERYRIERPIGTGGMAHVLAARHIELGHGVAIKILDPSLVEDRDAKERFSREARAMAQLTSKHTVRVHDVGTWRTGLPFMVMDLLEGKDLSQLAAERGPLPFDEACAYIEQACDALAEAHEAGLVHRDLKPQNLFLANVHDGPPIVRVLDFGIARAVGGRMGRFETITGVGDLVGTLSYMAPEQIKSAHSVDERTDVWALGACLYRLVTGKRPFEATPEAALVAAILSEPPAAIHGHRADVPTVLISVILRCLRKAPEERFPTARSLRSAIGEARSVMAVEPFLETTQPDRPTRTVLRTPTELEVAHTARESASFKKFDTTERMPTRPEGRGAVVPAAVTPLARTQVSERSETHVGSSRGGAPRTQVSASFPIVAVPQQAQKSRSGLLLVLIVLGVALLVFLGGLFVLFVA
ncbi:MAG: Serine/threonine-protein kinase pkn3 [Labilithrix sp.]|nr:Serine/threonine-protein kinase pkn3 [Labilithrix sp.]